MTSGGKRFCGVTGPACTHPALEKDARLQHSSCQEDPKFTDSSNHRLQPLAWKAVTRGLSGALASTLPAQLPVAVQTRAPPGLAGSSLLNRTPRARVHLTPLEPSPAHALSPPSHADTHLTRGLMGSTLTAQMRHRPAGESLGSPQLFVIEPKATPSSTGLSQHPAAPRDPRGQQSLRPQ